ncbi:hypothetical protein FRC04_007016 [Tulasnella sp. 424]|nr:hypothetical protein FRC04_007016 [Tulasnella sp. 424]KAG8973057.1 hypothetical protein FRC05_009172 [Tulasnella sp. 425]
MTLQLQRRSSSSVRAKSLVAKTKDFVGSMVKAFKPLDIKIQLPLTTSSLETLPAPADEPEPEPEFEFFYPSPPFTRRFTSTSQLSGSTGSTALASIFSGQTYQTNVTVAQDTECSEEAAGIASQTPSSQEGEDSLSTRVQHGLGDDGLNERFFDGGDGEDDEDEDDGVLLMRSKRSEPTRACFVTSLPRIPYAAFLSQPLYKQPYVFPTARPST